LNKPDGWESEIGNGEAGLWRWCWAAQAARGEGVGWVEVGTMGGVLNGAVHAPQS